MTYWLTVWLVNAGWWRGDCWLMTSDQSVGHDWAGVYQDDSRLSVTAHSTVATLGFLPDIFSFYSVRAASLFIWTDNFYFFYRQHCCWPMCCIVPSQMCKQVDNDNINCRFLSQLFHWQSWIRRISVDIHVSSTWDQMMKKKRIRRKECSVNLGLICYIILNN